MSREKPSQSPLHRPEFDSDACGFGLVAHLHGHPSHELVDSALTALNRLTHRGAIAADGKTGDGCGVMLVQPESFLRSVALEANIELFERFAAGMVFLPQDEDQAADCRASLENELAAVGLPCAGWRVVPTDPAHCGDRALETLPRIEQVFVNGTARDGRVGFERKLFRARRLAEKSLYPRDPVFYVVSLSARNIVYKGMVMPDALARFYPDLADPRMATSVCVFHQRFSTNTFPAWWLAQPFRLLAHNGEINTIAGNRSWAVARGPKLHPEDFPGWDDVLPLVDSSGSDSSSLDNMLEGLLAGGIDVLQAMRMLLPPAWETVDSMDPDVQAFYEFFGAHIEPWDGPAGVVLSDGRYAACALDRNGLRPARYTVTDDHIVTISSETGVTDAPAERIVAKGKLGPGQMLAVDMVQGTLLDTDAIEDELKQRAPFKRWLKDGLTYLDSLLFDSSLAAEPMSAQTLATFEKMFNITTEERADVLRALAETEAEAVGSMGDDTPIAIMSNAVRPLYDYFRQNFAQVTNPPIDPLRETVVMSLQTRIGRKGNVFSPHPAHAHHIALNSPILSQSKLRQIMALSDAGIEHAFFDLNQPADLSLDDALSALCDAAEKAVLSGKMVLLLSDREVREGHQPIHALLATGAVHHHLVAKGLRCDCNILVETGTARDPHHFACLIGCGATAVYPFMAYQCLNDMRRTGEISRDQKWRQLGRSYRRGIKKGLLKIMSKMGISTISSYRSAKLFEAIGLNHDVIERCFPGMVSRIEGVGLSELHEDQSVLAARAFDPSCMRDHGGQYRYVHDGEYHMYNPEVVGALQTAALTGDWDHYKLFRDLVNERPSSALRDLLEAKPLGDPISVDDVEPIEDILPRFECAGMSLGALSPEAHEALAIAMNRLGGRSNSGEGGEDPARHGTERRSKIKQIASGRFGVTPEYLVNAEVLQIKMAQGAKPGEGGQLPGHKVNEQIARLRYANPGVGLISPPPHHDIYSIEDLAQLIFDLKQVNPDAMVSVKLVAEPGVGTVAVGVTKAYADLITISGHDGGTGASPLTSVKYAGGPWELGLAEAHQLLRERDMRQRVRLQTDGGLKTGLDVIKGALLGAESFGFGTAPLIALGCKYLRICHLNNCATGVATQHNVLRKKFFVGKPQIAMNYFKLVAQDVRETLASLGARSIDDIIGRADLLAAGQGSTKHQQTLNLTPLIDGRGLSDQGPRFCTQSANDPFDQGKLAQRIHDQTQKHVLRKSGGEFAFDIVNSDRSIGARLSGDIARAHGDHGMDDAPILLNLNGTAGQSFGAFNAGGLHMVLDGDANDYVGKGMTGGKIVVRPHARAQFVARKNIIIGNTCLYGATGGRLYAAGRAGERFAVRNSGAVAIVEGAGDHCCEYMTGGVVAVIGEAGTNFGAGMTGGFAYVLDEKRDFVDRYNHELIDIHRLSMENTEAQVQHLRALLTDHVNETNSQWAEAILLDYRSFLKKFWIVKPKATALNSLLSTLRNAA
ncbi:MAG: glutamate synthase large subunit [Gammaproteobacteria bacterium]